ncbi:DUF2179 domain-containing protein [Candidatus Woesearchaeota archaeon]|nr:DUF2179 domain-containing protein [Candidatus Woesearchaeota archaeon]
MAVFLGLDYGIWWAYVIIPILIFFARIADVTLGTIRLMFISKGFKYLAPILGFFEVTIWLLAIQQIFNHLDNVFCYLGYSLGFATGNYVGIILGEYFASEKILIRIITRQDSSELLKVLQDKKFIATTVGAKSKDGDVKLILLVVNQSYSQQIINYIQKYNPKAFYTIENVKYAKDEPITSKPYHAFGFFRKER